MKETAKKKGLDFYIQALVFFGGDEGAATGPTLPAWMRINYGPGGGGSMGGSVGGARAVDSSYRPSMGGFAGLGIGNPTSYGGGVSGGRDSGGLEENDGNSDTADNHNSPGNRAIGGDSIDK